MAVYEKFIEVELTQPVDLCAPDGSMNPDAKGWSRRPMHACALSGRWPRKKRWNYWCITSPTHLFSATIADLDYAAQAMVYVMDFERKQFHEAVAIAPLGRGCQLEDALSGNAEFESGGHKLTFRTHGGVTELNVECARIARTTLSAHFAVETPPRQESCNVVIPWNPTQFVYTSKQPGLHAAGDVYFGPASIAFEAGESYACLDFVRGIWPYKTAWQWASGSGVVNGRTISLNLGGTWTDGTGATENAFFIDGAITKISEDLAWEFDAKNYMKPWTIKAPISNQIRLTFTPFYERIAKSNLLVVRSEVHQMFGHFEGTLKTENDQSVQVSDLLGWVETHRARW